MAWYHLELDFFTQEEPPTDTWNFIQWFRSAMPMAYDGVVLTKAEPPVVDSSYTTVQEKLARLIEMYNDDDRVSAEPFLMGYAQAIVEAVLKGGQ